MLRNVDVLFLRLAHRCDAGIAVSEMTLIIKELLNDDNCVICAGCEMARLVCSGWTRCFDLDGVVNKSG